MKKGEIITKFGTGQMTGSDLLALPHNSNADDVGRVLVEMYYLLIDYSEGNCLPTNISMGEILANNLIDYWEDEL